MNERLAPSHTETMANVDQALAVSAEADKHNQQGGVEHAYSKDGPGSLHTHIERSKSDAFGTKVSIDAHVLSPRSLTQWDTTIDGHRGARTKIIRTDSSGKEVYRFESKDKEFARKIARPLLSSTIKKNSSVGEVPKAA